MENIKFLIEKIYHISQSKVEICLTNYDVGFSKSVQGLIITIAYTTKFCKIDDRAVEIAAEVSRRL